VCGPRGPSPASLAFSHSTSHPRKQTSVRTRLQSYRYMHFEFGFGPCEAFSASTLVNFSCHGAGPPRESPADFRIASPLHDKKETPGEAPGVGSPLLTASRNATSSLRNTPVPPGTADSSPVRFRGALRALRNKCRVSKTNAPSLCRRPSRSAT
jgi:hypothetical protein